MTRAFAFVAELVLWMGVALIAATVGLGISGGLALTTAKRQDARSLELRAAKARRGLDR